MGITKEKDKGERCQLSTAWAEDSGIANVQERIFHLSGVCDVSPRFP